MTWDPRLAQLIKSHIGYNAFSARQRLGESWCIEWDDAISDLSTLAILDWNVSRGYYTRTLSLILGGLRGAGATAGAEAGAEA